MRVTSTGGVFQADRGSDAAEAAAEDDDFLAIHEFAPFDTSVTSFSYSLSDATKDTKAS